MNSVARWCNTTQLFCKTGVILPACAHGRRKDFLQGAESGEIRFLPLETKKTAFFANIFKFLPPCRPGP